MNRSVKDDILSLSIPERIRLVEDIWDSIAEHPDALSLSDDQKKILDERLRNQENDPEIGRPWGEVLENIKSRP